MKTRLQEIFHSMKQRCYNPNAKSYKHYGGRGIVICDEWLSSSKTFYNWSNDNGYKEGLTIDRIDNNKGYSPENCRWVSAKVQANNKRNNRVITYKGETKTLAEWCEVLDLDYDVIEHRLSRSNWNAEKAFNTRKNAYIIMIDYNGKSQSLYKWSKELKIPYNTLYSRFVEMGWSVEKTFSKNRGN